jgi:hypothetical protein
VNFGRYNIVENNVDYYKERFPVDMHWLILEEGSALPVKADNFIAKDISFAAHQN